ncbi:RDD family protein [Amedibacillus sp. YH-ame6]
MVKAKQKKEDLYSRLPDISGNSLKARYVRRIKTQLKYASLMKRFLAFLIDFLLSSIFVSIIPMIITSIATQEKSFTITNMMKLSIELQILCCLIAIVFAIYYFCIYPSKSTHCGQTIGKRIMYIKVQRRDGQDVSLRDLLKRELLGSMLLEGETAFPSAFVRYIIFLCIPSMVSQVLTTLTILISLCSILYCIVDSNRRMLHDFVAKTNVVDL